VGGGGGGRGGGGGGGGGGGVVYSSFRTHLHIGNAIAPLARNLSNVRIVGSYSIILSILNYVVSVLSLTRSAPYISGSLEFIRSATSRPTASKMLACFCRRHHLSFSPLTILGAFAPEDIRLGIGHLSGVALTYLVNRPCRGLRRTKPQGRDDVPQL